MRIKISSLMAAIAGFVLLFPAVASAHVVVTPGSVAAGSTMDFSVSVPNEKQIPMTGLQLFIPAAISDVTPTVHAGWTITVTESGDAVSEVTWQGGEIPVGQRDDFSLRAVAPASPTELHWKAVQTYADGSTVAWDQVPTANEKDDDSSSHGPYSVTKVTKAAAPAGGTNTSSTAGTEALVISLAALVLSVVTWLHGRRSGTSKKA